MTQAYPLHWPLGFGRTKGGAYSKFRTGLDAAVQNVTKSLRAFANDGGKDVTNVVLSSNVTMMNQNPQDGGVALYFRWDNMDCCIAVDRYSSASANVQAIHHIIEAERVKLRHGGLNIVRATFRGFTALPPPKGPDGQLAAPWWMVLGLAGERDATLADAEARYRALVKETHPDRGGDAGRFAAVSDAIRTARETLGGARP